MTFRLSYLLFSLCLIQSLTAQPPDIVFILADDLGNADVGWHGSDIKTPNLDKLAASGAKLEHFYVMPVCTPTRVAFLTGRYPIRSGMHVTATVAVLESPRLPIRPKLNRCSRPARPWMANPLAASLTVTRKESNPPAAAVGGAGV
jgi:arylsulfatase A-like enzyme